MNTLHDAGSLSPAASIARMQDVLARQKKALLSEAPPTAELRTDRINRVIALLLDNQQKLCESLAADFTWRSHDQSLMSDILLPLASLKYARKHLSQWMKPERRRPEMRLGLLGAKAEIYFQPIGSVGIMTPWNFPVAIALAPLAEVFAAGNRALISLSDLSPSTANLLIELIAARFDDTELAAFVGGAEVGGAFSALPLDHLVFTGSPRVGKLVMRAAAENLTPLTLELGGKSPTIVGRGADLDNAARRIWGGKSISSGQACVAPDYVMVHEDDKEKLVASMVSELRRMFPTILDNPDYTAMATPGQYQRMQKLLADARERQLNIVEVNPAQEDLSNSRKVAPTMFIDPPQEALVMQDEIFGPLLPILSYRHIDEVISYINARPRPLALYYFGDEAEAEQVLARTSSGGACINEVMQHLFQRDLPFGGSGNSGFGRYGGKAGFLAFSQQRSVFSPPHWDIGAMLRPPYGEKMRRAMRFLLQP